jgi:guanine deaminase
MNRDEEIMHELIEYAFEKMLSKDAYPFCAFVVKDGEVVSRGFNERVNLYGDKTTHGEMEAMRRATRAQSSGLFLKGNGLYSTCEPCLACFDTGLWSGITKFVFAVDHSDFPEYFNDHSYTTKSFEKAYPDKVKFIRGLLHDEGMQLFRVAKRKYGW